MVIHNLGRKENSLERMWISPDNQFITFTGRDGHMLLLSQKVLRQWNIYIIYRNHPSRHLTYIIK